MKVAVIGSGPCGLSFAGDMSKLGYSVTVFEALHEIGGVLKYGIPEFRLPNSVVDTEIDALRQMGVEFQKDCIVGKTITYDNLHQMGFKGIFVASGAGLPRFMNIPGENLGGVMSSNEYLTRVNLMGAGREGYDTPVMQGKRVAIIGGGNTAMDSVRTALRMGAEKAMLVYRRSDAEMPARAEEVKHAREEGVEFLTLHNPIEYLGDEKGRVCTMRLQQMQLGEPDASGRRSPVPIEGAIKDIPVDLVIVSVGVSPNPIVPNSITGLEVSKRGTIVVDETSMQSSIADIYAVNADTELGKAVPTDFHCWNEEWDKAPAFVRPEHVNTNDDTLLIYFTSGTSGEPKMVAHDHLYALGHLATGVFWHNLNADSIHLTVADTGWGKAVWGKLYGQWFAGATVFVYDHEKFTAEKIMRQIEKYRITSFCAPPTY